MTKRSRKYVAHKWVQRNYSNVLANTFYYHSSCMTDIGARVGNHRYTLTDEQARLIISRPQTWSGVVIAFFVDANGNPYLRSETISEAKPVSREELNDILEDAQLRLVTIGNTSQCTSTGYYIVPDCTIDVEDQMDFVMSLFEPENPYDYTVTVLAGMLRENALKVGKLDSAKPV